MKNQRSFSFSLLLGWLAFSPCAIAQLPPDCGGPPTDVPPAEDCMSTCIYCDFNSLQNSTMGYQANPAPPGFCSSVENDQWIGFIATTTSRVFTITPSNCANGDGLQAAFYSNCNQPPLICLSGQQGGGNIPLTVNAVNLIPGRHYFLMIDGYAGDACDFSITASPANMLPTFGTIGQITGLATVCPGAQVKYGVGAVTSAGAYTWTSPTSGVLFNGLPSPVQVLAPEGRQVEVNFPKNVTGNVQICVNVDNSCNTGPMRCRTVNVQPIPPTTFQPVTICNEDAPYILPWGEEAMTVGKVNYKTTLTSYLGCDSVVQQQVTIKPPLTTNIGTKYICAGNKITVCGNVLNMGGPFSETCTSFQGCDSIVTGQLVVLTPHAQIVANSHVFSCKYPEITLKNGLPTSGTMIWRKLPGTVMGVTPSIKVTTFGHYTLTTTQTLGGVTCIDADSILINKSNTQQPGLIKITVSGQFSSATPYVQLKAKSVTSGLQYEWEGPQGFKSKQQNPYVFTPGVYTVIGTDPSNGCQRTGGIKVLME